MRYRSYNVVLVVNFAVLGAAVVGFFLIGSAIAQTAATSSPEVSEEVTQSAMSTTTSDAPPNPVLSSLREVRIIGTKYTDYFTDGTTLVAFPGDAAIHENIAKQNAPTPSHEGLIWDHSDGTYLYDTPSGELEIGTFAEQLNGTYLAYLATTTIENATSTPLLPARVVTLQKRPAASAQVPPAVSEQNPPQDSTPAASASSTSSQHESIPANARADAVEENIASTTAVEIIPEPPARTQEVGQVRGTTTEQNQMPQSDAVATSSSAEAE